MLKKTSLLTVWFGVAAAAACWHAVDRPAFGDDKAANGATLKDTDATRPCGTYDIRKLGDHFRVTVDIRRLATGLYEVAIRTVNVQDAKDSRKPFPTDRLRLRVQDAKGSALLEAPIGWSKGRHAFNDGKDLSASFVVAPEMADRVILLTPPVELLSSALDQAVIVGFRSLAASGLQPQVSGVVRSHVDTYRSGTGSSVDLVHGTQMTSGFHYGDGKKADWKSEIRWNLVGHQGESDEYRFTWEFKPVGGISTSKEENVVYDGKKPVTVFQNDSETVSIETGSIPMPQQSQRAPSQ